MAAATDPAWLDGGRMLPLVEDFYTIQGEGFHAGKPAYFIRLGGCDVGCRWCDAKYTWNPKLYPPTDVQTVIDRAMSCPAQAIVITGGEPLLYPLGVLTETLRERGLQIFLETSGSHPFSGVFDWVCLSPKRRQPPLDEAFERADELKVIVESEEDFEWAERNAAENLPPKRLDILFQVCKNNRLVTLSPYGKAAHCVLQKLARLRDSGE